MASPWAALAILVLFYAALVGGVRSKSATLDEPGHLTAGYAYWHFGDYRLDPENGNLPQRWAALPLLFGDSRFPSRSEPAWQNADLFALSDAWLYQPANNATAMIAQGRAAIAVLAVLLGVLVWHWSRRIFGPVGGLISLLLYALNPGILANGALMTSDIAAALCLLVSLFSFWTMLRSPALATVAVSAIAMGVLFVAKMSAVVMVPVALVLALLRLVDGRPMLWRGPGSRSLDTRRQRAGFLAGAALVHVVVVMGIIWAAFGFRYRAFAPDSPVGTRFPWETVLESPSPYRALQDLGLTEAQARQSLQIFSRQNADPSQWSLAAQASLAEIKATVLDAHQARQLAAANAGPSQPTALALAAFAREHRLLPEAYLYGCAYVWKHAKERVVFLNGEVRVNDGWWFFFPFTFLVKTPLATLGVAALALTALWRHRHCAGNTGTADADRPGDALWELTPLWVFAGFYWGIAIVSGLNIGHRHLLPIYPPLFVVSGAVAWWLASPLVRTPPTRSRLVRWLAPATGLMIAGLAIEAVAWFPNYLSYFNGLVRPSQGYRHLIDSSLDWAQDLPGLHDYLKSHPPTGPLYLAQFGRGVRPDYYGIRAVRLATGIAPPLVLSPGVSVQNDRPAILEFLRTHPEYDSRVVGSTQSPTGPGVVLLRNAAALRLRGGTYVISATLIQPIQPGVFGAWTAAYETEYQRLRTLLTPLLSDDPTIRAKALDAHPWDQWLQAFDTYDRFRFARLAAHLRKREPDAQVNYSFLIYHLDDQAVSHALDGPAP